MERPHNELVRLSKELFEKAEALRRATTGLNLFICQKDASRTVEAIEQYLFEHPGIAFSDKNRKLLSPHQNYKKYPESLKSAAFLLQQAVIPQTEKPVAKNTELSDDKEDNSYLIIKRENSWSFYYEGGLATVKSTLKALPQLEILLTHPGEEYSATNLRQARYGKEGEPMPLIVGKKAQAIIEDPGTLRKAINKLHEYREQATRPEVIDQIEKEIQQAEDYYQKNVNVWGQSRPFSDYDKDRTAVIRLFDRVKKAIKKEHDSLYCHLEAFLTIGQSNCYKPEKNIPWISRWDNS